MMLNKFWIYLSSGLLIALLWFRGQTLREKLKRERDHKLAAISARDTMSEANEVINEANIKIQEELENVENHDMDNTKL